jgi:hypothetical protein
MEFRRGAGLALQRRAFCMSAALPSAANGAFVQEVVDALKGLLPAGRSPFFLPSFGRPLSRGGDCPDGGWLALLQHQGRI